MSRVPTVPVLVHERRGGALVGRPDMLAVEEPLEIRLRPGHVRGDAPSRGETSTLSVTMRTPGHDFELVAGFLLSEGVVDSGDELARIAYCLDRSVARDQRYNVVTAELHGAPGRAGIERHVLTSSACGVCGSSSIDAVRSIGHPALGSGPLVGLDELSTLPDLLGAVQKGFAATGGLHAAALVGRRSPGDAPGASGASGALEVLAAREDVGRHNAVDKVIGRALLDGAVPCADTVLVVSGRVSFEIVQKALRAGIAFVAAVSAATSLAVRLADDSGMTLVGFVRGDRCTVYAGRHRLVTIGAAPAALPPAATTVAR